MARKESFRRRKKAAKKASRTNVRNLAVGKMGRNGIML